MQHVDEKVNKLVREKFKAEYKLKTIEEEKELKRRMDELQMMDSFSKKKRSAIEEELKNALQPKQIPTPPNVPPKNKPGE